MTDQYTAPKDHGIKHLIAATRYSLAGARTMLGESSFRQELALVVALLGVYWVIGASAALVMTSALFLILLLVTEILNTAIESIVDHVSPGYSEFAKVTKDLGSFAVMCMILGNLAYAGWIIWVTLRIAG